MSKQHNIDELIELARAKAYNEGILDALCLMDSGPDFPDQLHRRSTLMLDLMQTEIAEARTAGFFV